MNEGHPWFGVGAHVVIAVTLPAMRDALSSWTAGARLFHLGYCRPHGRYPKNLELFCDVTHGCVVWSTTNCRAHVEVERQYERGNPAVATEQGDDSFHSQVDRRIREQSHPYVREPRAVKLACCVVVVVIVVIVGNWYCCWLAGGWLPYTGNLLAL